MNYSQTIEQLKARLTAEPPTLGAALPMVNEIATRAALAATRAGMAPRVAVRLAANQIVVEVSGRGARSTAQAIGDTVRRTLPTMAGAVRAQAVSSLGR